MYALGMGGAFASLVSNVPGLIALSKYKVITFSVTGLVLGFSWWQVRRVSQCSIADAKRLKWQKGILWIATILLIVSVFAAYALLPIMMWLDQIQQGV